jgi:hypothetical protein
MFGCSNIGLAVKIASQFCLEQDIYPLPVCQPPSCAVQRRLMSADIGAESIESGDPENIGITVGTASLSSFRT